MFIQGLKPLSPKDVAEAVLFCATRPTEVNINQIILTPCASFINAGLQERKIVKQKYLYRLHPLLQLQVLHH